MRNHKLLAVMAVATITVSACSSNENDMFLGSRDDIIVNNNGMTKAAAETAVKSKIETAKMDAQAKVKSEAQNINIMPPETAVVTDGVNTAKTVVMEKAQEVMSSDTSSETTMSVAAPMPAGASGDIPPNARPGECYAKVLIPAVKQTKSARVQVSEEKKVLNRIIPARYEVQTERIQVSEEQRVLNRIIPARYEVKTERILVSPARQYWKAGHGPVTKKNEVTGEIMCLVEEPAKYKTIEKRVLVEEEKPEYKTVPAQFKTIEKRVLVAPEKPEYRIVPAQFETITKNEIVRPESWEWRRILCETNMGTNSIQRIQQALRSKGYSIAVDGRLGNETMNALNSYQRKNGLATRGITYETLESLGVQLVGA